MDYLYPFIYKGLLTEESLDKAGRKEKEQFGSNDANVINSKLSLDMVDEEAIIKARKMSLVYTAIHSFENMVRQFVMTAMVEKYKEEWWEKVSNKIKGKVAKRMEDEAKLRWHGARGGSEIEYCDFGDLSSIIVTNWEIFEPVLVDMEWTKSLLAILERSRNVVMHGGELGLQDIERIGGNIRDWVRQAG